MRQGMIRLAVCLLALGLLLSSVPPASASEGAPRRTASATAKPNARDPRYLQYVRDYTGQNALNVGYTSLGGNRMDQYGSCYLEIIYIAPDGEYVDIDADAQLRQYTVIGQNPAPGSEIRITYEKNSSGEEYSNLTESQSYESVDLYVRRVGSAAEMKDFPQAPQILPSPDKYTCYIRNYVGKNLANVGYTSLGGTRNDRYGAAYVQFSFVTEDGTYIDPEDEDLLRQYRVVGQDVAPNSKMTLVFTKDSSGKEYSNLVDSQTYDRITLRLEKLAPDAAASRPTAAPKPTKTPRPTNTPRPTAAPKAQTKSEETVQVKLSGGGTVTVRKSVKKALDAYEAFMDGYKDAIAGLSSGNYSGYLTFMTRYQEYIDQIDELEKDLTTDESLYMMDVSLRILDKMY